MVLKSCCFEISLIGVPLYSIIFTDLLVRNIKELETYKVNNLNNKLIKISKDDVDDINNS